MAVHAYQSHDKSRGVSAPLRDRFGVSCKFEMYTPDELKKIIGRSASILGVSADEKSMKKSTPRVAMLFSQVKGDGNIDIDITNRALSALGVDEMGLESLDREILRTIIERFQGQSCRDRYDSCIDRRRESR